MRNTFIFRKQGYTVPPLSSKAIAKGAYIVRNFLGHKFTNGNFLDIVKLIEDGNLQITTLDNKKEDIGLLIVPTEELKNAEALTFPDGTIKIPEKVYEEACQRKGRARFTLAHELGHALMHSNIIPFARSLDDNHKIYEDSEWQADEFAGELLIPSNELKYKLDVPDEFLMEEYGISYNCLQTRKRKIKNPNYVAA